MKKLRKYAKRVVRAGDSGDVKVRRVFALRRRSIARKSEIKKVMKFRQSLFWDTDPKTINVEKHKRYIIERILDFGNDREVYWMWHFYGKKLIADVVKKSRVLHGQTRSLWALLIK